MRPSHHHPLLPRLSLSLGLPAVDSSSSCGAAGKLLRSWGDGVLDTPHAVRIKQPMHAGDKVEIWITDMGADAGQGHVIKAFTPTGDLLATIGRVGNNGTGLDPLQFGNVVSHHAARVPAPLCASQLWWSLTMHGARIRCRRIWTGPATRARWLSSTATAARTTAPCASPPPLA